MLNRRKRAFKLAYILVDFLFIIIGIEVGTIIYEIFSVQSYGLNKLEEIGLVTITSLVIILLRVITNNYEEELHDRKKIRGKTWAKIYILLLIAALAIKTIMEYNGIMLPILFYICCSLSIYCMLLLSRIIIQSVYYYEDNKFRVSKNIVIVGYSKKGEVYIDQIKEHNYLDYKILGYVDINPNKAYEGIEHIGTLGELEYIAQENVIDEIVVTKSIYFDEELYHILNSCQAMGITITMLLGLKTQMPVKSHVAMVGDIPVLKIHTVSLNEAEMLIKRLMDIGLGLIGFIVFMLLYVIVGPIIKLESKGPVLFRQKRVGRNGRVFNFYKFRTMVADAESLKAELVSSNEMSGHMFKMENDPRVTKFGRFLRKTSIDEFPQFYNVLRGEMSIVGTRPPTLEEVEAYELYQRRRISITPGITGQWQVSGRSEIKDFEEILKIDSDYIMNWSLRLDLKIILKTIYVVLFRKGSC